MNKNKALEVMLTEKCCVERQEDISKCDRRCGECDLLLPTEEVLQAYDFVINMLTEKEEKRPKGKWLFKEITNDYKVYGQCSICKQRKRIDNFCPHCGADNRGTDNETDN